MKNSVPILSVVVLSLLFVTGCDFISGVFKTGIGVGVFVAIIILVLIIFIVRMGRRRP